MPLTFPLAETARAALDATSSARTLGEARDKAGAVVSLVSEWLRPSASERETLQERIDAGVAAGFVQVYEDNQGQPVVAVTFWKRGEMRPPPPVKATPAPAQAAPAAATDTVDDLYFEKSGASRRRAGQRGRRSQIVDPSQLDLFAGPDQQGFEAPDPGNPDVVIVEEEGSGAAFGLAAKAADAAAVNPKAVAKASPKAGKGEAGAAAAAKRPRKPKG